MIDRRLVLAAAILAIALGLFAFRPHATPGPFLRDFEAYYAGGIAWDNGTDPYSRDVWRIEGHVPGVDATRDEVLPFVSPPYALPLFALLGHMPYAIAARVWTAVLVLSLAVVVFCSLRLTAIRLSVAALIASGGLAVGFAPITSDLALGQVALLSYAGVVLAVTASALRAIVPAFGVLLAAIQPNVSLALAVLFTRRRGTAVVLAALAIIAGAALGAGAHLVPEYLATLTAHKNAEALNVIQQTPAAVAYGFGVPASVAPLIGYAIAVVTMVFGIWLIARAHSLAQRFLIACAALPLISAFFHEHDLLVAFAPVVWCARNAPGRLRDLALFATMLVAIDWLGLAQRPDGIVQSTLLAFAAICCFAALSETQPFPWRGAALAAAALAAGSIVATLHPAPVWPDAMGAYHAQPGDEISQVWFAEQQRSGLTSPNAWWALLRAFALIGSALLVYATARSSPKSEDLMV